MSIDPRGIIRNVVSVEQTPSANLVRFDCGHLGNHAPHFAPPKVGTVCHCFACGQEAREAGQ